MLNGHGNDRYNYQNIVADFSSNILPTGIHPELSKFIVEQVDSINYYPDPNCSKFAKAVANYHGLLPENVVACNGSIEGIYLIAQHFNEKKSQIVVPAFGEYEDACLRYNHTLSFSLDTRISTGTALVWLGNPNNPDGKIIPGKNIEKLCANHQETILIIDESYAELAPNFNSAVSLIPKFNNLIVLRSLTKIFSIPGLRIGYLLTNEPLANKIKGWCIPWSVNQLALQAGVFIMNNYQKLLPDITAIQQHSTLFQQEIQSIEGMKVTPSNCNFFLVEMAKGTASSLKNMLAKQYGFLIRDASNFRKLTPRHFRLSTQTTEQNAALISALKQLFDSDELQ